MKAENIREIPYNYTSADDELIVKHLFDASVWEKLETLRTQRVTGRSAKLLMRLMGDLFILRRNPFIYEDLADSLTRRRKFFKTAYNDLAIIEKLACNPEVHEILVRCRKRLKKLSTEIASYNKRKLKIKKTLGKIIGEENVCFEPYSLISHATDATDWRLYLPVAVLRPTGESQVAPLLEAVEHLKLHVIPRGAGTGLTGGAVPVSANCVMINTEKLNRIRGIKEADFTSDTGEKVMMSVLNLEAGVITQDAMEHASAKDLVFATDPTSSWACTIGGNIAENAGGKKAVMWGTAIDNLVSYNIAMPGGAFLEVRRDNHPMRKIDPGDMVSFSVRDQDGRVVRHIELSGTDIRKEGLGKDITNKALKGLPGIQKEGTDGVITSAEFILYPEYKYKKTFCLEFFGNDMEEASDVIVKISKEFVNGGEEALIALEHFDDEYMQAINYKVKAPRSESPKAVLLVDMVGNAPEQIENGINRLTSLLTFYPNTMVFVAKDDSEAERFWKDRKKLGAIARRTNAFKLNEDIVIPLDVLGEFTRFVDCYNVEEDRHNQQAFTGEILGYLEEATPIEDPEWLLARIPRAREICNETLRELEKATPDELKGGYFAEKLLARMLEYFRGYNKIRSELERLHKDTRSKRIIIATHMHAGDGNVHVNIPVFSNDVEMMKRAAKTADDVMEEAVRLKGVVSGEHGIGITKMKYLDPQRVEELNAYRSEVDPGGLMNPGQLMDPEIINKVFTPSFNLLELEANILQYSSLETLATKISSCVRCGKCKIDCCTFFPGKNLFFHPRNKNLAIASLIEAILYDVQRSHSTRFKPLKQLEEIADHCTLCHKCFKPCPVDIDTAEVSILERGILTGRKFKHTPIATKASLKFLQTQSRPANAVMRKILVSWGGDLQRFGHKATASLRKIEMFKNIHTLQVLESPIPKASSGTLRKILPKCQSTQALVITPEEHVGSTVFYFPGCGSERLFSDISMASIYILLKTGVRVVLPPPFLCCGFPAKANAKTDLVSQISLRKSIVFSQIREMLSYYTFDACVVSCGTCSESLHDLGTEKIFGCAITDVSRFTLEKGLSVSGNENCLYHAPCHDSMNGDTPTLLKKIAGYTVESVRHCCSEGGTMALSRPDITNAMLSRKRDLLELSIQKRGKDTVVLTNCPSCIQGLGRNSDLGVVPRHIAVELALQTGGQNWKHELVTMTETAEPITF